MNWRTIAVTAALLALQATVLSLLHNGSAQAELVYRCGHGDYRALPCHQAGDKTDGLTFKDDRTEAQLSQALSLRPQPGQGATPRGTATPIARATALSRHRSGMAPFHDGRDLSDATVNKASGHSRDPHRVTRGRPFVARSPKSGSPADAATSTGWR